MSGNYFPMDMVLQRIEVIERWSYSVCIFFTDCDPGSDIQLWLYQTVEERDYELKFNKSNIDVFLLAEEDSFSKIIQGYTLKNALADTKGFALKKQTVYCFLNNLSLKQYLLLKNI